MFSNLNVLHWRIVWLRRVFIQRNGTRSATVSADAVGLADQLSSEEGPVDRPRLRGFFDSRNLYGTGFCRSRNIQTNLLADHRGSASPARGCRRGASQSDTDAPRRHPRAGEARSEEHTSELQSRLPLVCPLLLA